MSADYSKPGLESRCPSAMTGRLPGVCLDRDVAGDEFKFVRIGGAS